MFLATSKRATRNSRLKKLQGNRGLNMKVIPCGTIISNGCKTIKIFSPNAFDLLI